MPSYQSSNDELVADAIHEQWMDGGGWSSENWLQIWCRSQEVALDIAKHFGHDDTPWEDEGAWLIVVPIETGKMQDAYAFCKGQQDVIDFDTP